MRLAGRLLFAAALLVLALLLLLWLRAGLGSAGLTASAARPSYGAAEPSLVYALRREATKFVLSRPQQRVRILTNAELRPGTAEPRYGFLVEALDSTGAAVWRRTIYVRSIPLFVRDRRGKHMPHMFLAERGALQPSAADTILIDFAEPVSAILISAGKRDPGVGRILARVQEQRPMSGRQLEIGWQRLSKSEQAQLTAGNPLGPSLTSAAERQRLLSERWNPVGPAGVAGRDYSQTIIYERPGTPVPPRPAS